MRKLPSLARFFQVSNAERLALLEAAGWLLIAWVAVRCVPFRRIAPFLGKVAAVDKEDADDRIERGGRIEYSRQDERLQVGLAIARASHHLPWECTCLMQAIAGRAMLKRRGRPTALYLGVAKVRAGSAEATEDLAAHAWLSSEGMIVTGRCEAERFTPLACFRGLVSAGDKGMVYNYYYNNCVINSQEMAMIHYIRTQVLLEPEQQQALAQIALQEGRSVSDVLREMVARQLQQRRSQQMASAAQRLAADYAAGGDLTALTLLDDEDFYHA